MRSQIPYIRCELSKFGIINFILFCTIVTEAHVNTITTVLSADAGACGKKEMIYGDLGHSLAELDELKDRVRFDATPSASFFRGMLLKSVNKNHTVQDIIVCLTKRQLLNVAGKWHCRPDIYALTWQLWIWGRHVTHDTDFQHAKLIF